MALTPFTSKIWDEARFYASTLLIVSQVRYQMNRTDAPIQPFAAMHIHLVI